MFLPDFPIGKKCRNCCHDLCSLDYLHC